MGSLCNSPSIISELPSDVVQKIFKSLSMKDLCNAAQSSRNFREITSQVSCLNLYLPSTAAVLAKVRSFRSFIFNRLLMGMKVEHLSIRFQYPNNLAPNAQSPGLEELADVIFSCSQSLQQLFISNCRMADLNLPATADSLMAAILSCKQLRSLKIRQFSNEDRQTREILLMDALLASLPELRTWQFSQRFWWELEAEERAEVFGDNIIAEVVADKQSSLQLLVMENCDIADSCTVPQTVRYLYLNIRFCSFHGTLEHTLGTVPSLEELYLIASKPKNLAGIESLVDASPRLITAPHLRAAVLDINEALSLSKAILLAFDMPNLELLALTNHVPGFFRDIDATFFPLHVRLPQLKECMLLYRKEGDTHFLRQLTTGGAPKLNRLQVAFSQSDVDVGWDFFWCLWKSLNGAKELCRLDLIFLDFDEQHFEQRVRMALQDMSEVESMCLPGLETIGFFSAVYFQGERAPAFEAGSALAYEQGVHGVCNAVGNLVEQKILPSLQQIEMHPVQSIRGDALSGEGPRPDAAQNVRSTFVQLQRDHQLEDHLWLPPSCGDLGMRARVTAALKIAIEG